MSWIIFLSVYDKQHFLKNQNNLTTFVQKSAVLAFKIAGHVPFANTKLDIAIIDTFPKQVSALSIYKLTISSNYLFEIEVTAMTFGHKRQFKKNNLKGNNFAIIAHSFLLKVTLKL